MFSQGSQFDQCLWESLFKKHVFVSVTGHYGTEGKSNRTEPSTYHIEVRTLNARQHISCSWFGVSDQKRMQTFDQEASNDTPFWIDVGSKNNTSVFVTWHRDWNTSRAICLLTTSLNCSLPCSLQKPWFRCMCIPEYGLSLRDPN